MEVFGDIADVYREFADEAAGESPCFEAWARSIAADPAMIAWLEGLPALKRQPNLVFAAARWHGVRAPGPYDGLRQALLADTGPIRQTILSRSTQTNEAGRLATLLPAFAVLGEELALVEAGASAGLCLFPDAYDYVWTTRDGRRSVTGSGGPVLTAHTTGPVPFPDRCPTITWRAGVDLNPLDAGDPEQTAWLECLVWPEQADRRRRLRSAIDVARVEPPRIVAGDLLRVLPALVEEAPGVPVVFHSAVAVYLDPEGRAELARMMTALVRDGACHWVSNEGPEVLPGIDVPRDVVPRRFLLCVDGSPVAWTHGHGNALTWL